MTDMTRELTANELEIVGGGAHWYQHPDGTIDNKPEPQGSGIGGGGASNRHQPLQA